MQKRARKIRNDAFPVGDSRRWEPGMGSLKRRDRRPLLTENERIDEGMKHRPLLLAVACWIREGKPESGLIVARPMNNKQRRESTRAERLKVHVRRYEHEKMYATGKSSQRRIQRARL